MRLGKLSDDHWARLARRMGEIAEAPLIFDHLHAPLPVVLSDLRRDQASPRLLVVDSLTDPTSVEFLSMLPAYAVASSTWVVAVAADVPG